MRTVSFRVPGAFAQLHCVYVANAHSFISRGVAHPHSFIAYTYVAKVHSFSQRIRQAQFLPYLPAKKDSFNLRIWFGGEL
jgi:hypothetical protein